MPVILLIFSFLFASSDMAEILYQCTLKKARTLATNSSVTADVYTLKEVAEICKQDVNANHIEIRRAERSGSTHILELTWNENGKSMSRLAFFNITGSKLCNVVTPTITSTKDFFVNLNAIIDNIEYSIEYNSCEMGKDRSQYGFGFRTNTKKTCERICKAGEYRVGELFPSVFKNNQKLERLSSNHSNTNIENIPLLQNIECRPCPSTYPKTLVNDNKCYAEDGCEKGFTATKNKGGTETRPNKMYPKMGCISKCAETETLDEEGGCIAANDINKYTCNEIKKDLEYAKKWIINFNSAFKKLDMPGCNKSTFKDIVEKWHNGYVQFLQNSINGPCVERYYDSFLISLNYSEEFNKIHTCFYSLDNLPQNIDLTLYELLHRSDRYTKSQEIR